MESFQSFHTKAKWNEWNEWNLVKDGNVEKLSSDSSDQSQTTLQVR